jgi:molecular chaperone GrpE
VTKKQPEGERTAAPPEAGSFGDAAGEMADETFETSPDPRNDDISGVDNMLEEGAPLEPADVDDETPDPVGRAERAERALSERTADLQRLQAEYLNYKRRVDRDRELVRENATYAALAPIVEVLDTIDRAREHGELDAGLQAVSDQLERAVAGAGLVRYGQPGDEFDPRLHEALSHIGEDPDVEVTTAKVIAKVGYRIGDRVVRAAQVLVVDPAQA